MPIPPKLKAGCGAFLLFFSGFLCGLVALFFFLVFLIPRSEGWKGENSKRFLAKHIANRIKLNPDQQAKLRPGFYDYLDQRWELRSEYLKGDKAALEKYIESVANELTPEQLEKANTLKTRWWKGKKEMVASD